MENIESLERTLFDTCRNSIESLQNISSVEDLVLKKNEVIILFENMTKLEFLIHNNLIPNTQLESQFIHNQDLNEDGNSESYLDSDEKTEAEESNVFENNFSEEKINDEHPVEYHFDNSEVKNQSEDSALSNSEENIVPDNPQNNFSETENSDADKSDIQLSDNQEKERKFKLANIKGVSKVQSLFDDIESDDKPNSGSLVKSNVSTDYMEAEKPKPDFKLDLNDRIAFSQHLFGNSQVELNEVISHLNQFKTLDEAKEFLSDIYYQKDWSKVDDYAQRLWSLVESKFL